MKVASVPVSFVRRLHDIQTTISIIALLEDNHWSAMHRADDGCLHMELDAKDEQQQLAFHWITDHTMDPNLKVVHNLIDGKQFFIHVMLDQLEYRCLPTYIRSNLVGLTLVPVSPGFPPITTH